MQGVTESQEGASLRGRSLGKNELEEKEFVIWNQKNRQTVNCHEDLNLESQHSEGKPGGVAYLKPQNWRTGGSLGLTGW